MCTRYTPPVEADLTAEYGGTDTERLLLINVNVGGVWVGWGRRGGVGGAVGWRGGCDGVGAGWAWGMGWRWGWGRGGAGGGGVDGVERATYGLLLGCFLTLGWDGVGGADESTLN